MPVQPRSVAHLLVLGECSHPAEIVKVFARTPIDVPRSQKVRYVIAGVRDVLCVRQPGDGLADSVCVLLHRLVWVSDRGLCEPDLNLVQSKVVHQKLHDVFADIFKRPVRRISAVVYSDWLQLAVAPECPCP